jgi:hypothetical protein
MEKAAAENATQTPMPSQKLAVFGIPVEHWAVIAGGALIANQLIRTFQLVREEAAEVAAVRPGSVDVTESWLSLPSSVRLSILAALCLTGVVAVILRPLIQEWRRRRRSLVRLCFVFVFEFVCKRVSKLPGFGCSCSCVCAGNDVLAWLWRCRAVASYVQDELDSGVEVVEQVLFPQQTAATAAAGAAANQRRHGPASSSGGGANAKHATPPPAGPPKLAPLETGRPLGGRGPSQSISQRPLPGGNRAPVVGMAKKSSLHVRLAMATVAAGTHCRCPDRTACLVAPVRFVSAGSAKGPKSHCESSYKGQHCSRCAGHVSGSVQQGGGPGEAMGGVRGICKLTCGGGGECQCSQHRRRAGSRGRESRRAGKENERDHCSKAGAYHVGSRADRAHNAVAIHAGRWSERMLECACLVRLR